MTESDINRNCEGPKQMSKAQILKSIPERREYDEQRECHRCKRYVCEREINGQGQLCDDCAKLFFPALVIPKGYQAMTFDNFKKDKTNERIYNKAKEFLSSQKSLFVYGNTGSGKTHLQIAGFRSSLESLTKSAYIQYTSLTLVRPQEFQTKEDAEAELIEKYSSYKKLFIDDLFAIRTTAQGTEIIYSLFETILAKGKGQVFITSNLNLSQIQDIDDRVASRILRMCGPENIVKNDSADYSLKGDKIGK